MPISVNYYICAFPVSMILKSNSMKASDLTLCAYMPNSLAYSYLEANAPNLRTSSRLFPFAVSGIRFQNCFAGSGFQES